MELIKLTKDRFCLRSGHNIWPGPLWELKTRAVKHGIVSVEFDKALEALRSSQDTVAEFGVNGIFTVTTEQISNAKITN